MVDAELERIHMTSDCDRCNGYRVTAERREGEKYFYRCSACSPDLPQDKVRRIRDEHWRDIPITAFC